MNYKYLLVATLILGLFISCSDKQVKKSTSAKLELEESKILLMVGGSKSLRFVQPIVSNKTVRWISDNEYIATVIHGTVIAFAKGKATISAIVDSDTLKCEIIVVKKEYELLFSL